MIAWLLIAFGLTLVVTSSKLFKPVREHAPTAWLRALLKCPMCFGWWVGFAAGWVHFGPAGALGWPVWLEAFGDAFAASAWCWFVHVVLVHLGADKEQGRDGSDSCQKDGTIDRQGGRSFSPTSPQEEAHSVPHATRMENRVTYEIKACLRVKSGTEDACEENTSSVPGDVVDAKELPWPICTKCGLGILIECEVAEVKIEPQDPKSAAQSELHGLVVDKCPIGVYSHPGGGVYVAFTHSVDEETLTPLVHYYSTMHQTRWTRTVARFTKRFTFEREATQLELRIAMGLLR